MRRRVERVVRIRCFGTYLHTRLVPKSKDRALFYVGRLSETDLEVLVKRSEDPPFLFPSYFRQPFEAQHPPPALFYSKLSLGAINFLLK